MSPRCLLAVIALFVGGWRSRGRGGGVLAVRPIAQALRKHGAGTRRGTCPSAGGGGGSPCGSRRHTTLPAVASLVVPPLGPARRVLPVGMVVWFVPHSRSSASPPCRGALGGGVRFPLPSSPMSPRLPLAALAPFLGGCGCWGWGGGGAPSLPFLRRKHVAGTALARGTALVLLLGEWGTPRGPRLRPSHSAFAPAVPPPPGPARRLFPMGTVVWSVPHPLTAVPPSRRFVLGRGGRCPPLPSCIPHPWGGGGAWGGGGGASHFPFVALMSQARGAASLCRGGGVRLVAPVVALSTLRPPSRWSPRRGLHGSCPLRARSCGSSRHRCPPALPRCPRGGGSLVASPLSALPALWGAGLGGGGRCALFVSPPLHARRRQDVGTTQSRGEALGCCGGGGFPFGPSRPAPWFRPRSPG